MHIKELFDLTGRVALVTGGAGKYGKPMTEALAEGGATVIVASRDQEKCEKLAIQFRSKKLKVYGKRLDQSDESSAKELLIRIQKEFAAPQILVNCAVYRPMEKYYEDEVSRWDDSMAVNARGLFIMCRTFGNAMAKAGKGSIINIASLYGVVAPDMKIYEGTNMGTEPDYPYNKGGMIMYSKYLASYYAKKGVRINCISPGGLFNNQPEPFLSRYCAKVALGRMANYDEIKGAVVYLASDASSYVTGINLIVDGGFSVI
jgi:NAD(P)-dependent dehydrogenase (short-subunit alcohol dehydrogenase family)